MIQDFIVWVFGPLISFILMLIGIGACAFCFACYVEFGRWPWQKGK